MKRMSKVNFLPFSTWLVQNVCFILISRHGFGFTQNENQDGLRPPI